MARLSQTGAGRVPLASTFPGTVAHPKHEKEVFTAGSIRGTLDCVMVQPYDLKAMAGQGPRMETMALGIMARVTG
jgi:hypothetical protein